MEHIYKTTFRLYSAYIQEDANLCRKKPNIGVEFINLMTKLCTKCTEKIIMNRNHLKDVHNIELPDPLDLFKGLQRDSQSKKRTRLERMWYMQGKIRKYTEILHAFMGDA